VVDRDETSASETVRLVEALGASALVLAADVSDPASLAELFMRADEEDGLDIVVNNAGIICGPPPFPDVGDARIAQVIAVNFTAVVLGTRLAVDAMRRRGKPGAIVNTASRAALAPNGNDPVYAATKAGVLMFTQSCKFLHAQLGIRVNAICPAITETPFLEATGGGERAPWLVGSMQNIRPLSAEEVAQDIVALVVDESKAGDYVAIGNAPAEARV
jgi:NAD(P)-dependent dehydrogenase (short-subunit alcohol dehydrogenase family)